MKQRVYIDTSVVGGCCDDEFAEWSNALFEEFSVGIKIAVVSDITLGELQRAPEAVRAILARIPKENLEEVFLDQEAGMLAKKYIEEKVVGISHLLDAQHIAIATVKQVNVLTSWNFHDIVNWDRIRGFNAVNLKEGYSMIEIRSPREVLREKEI